MVDRLRPILILCMSIWFTLCSAGAEYVIIWALTQNPEQWLLGWLEFMLVFISFATIFLIMLTIACLKEVIKICKGRYDEQ